MTTRRLLLLALLPLFAGCQSLGQEPATRSATERLQGTLIRIDDRLLLQTCHGNQQVELIDNADGDLAGNGLWSEGAETLFADLRGRLVSHADGSRQLHLSRLYRLQHEGHGCEAEGFRQLILRASGNEPFWSLRITRQGMLLERPGQPPLALPYLEERLPNEQTSFTSEAGKDSFSLWVAPQYCQDSASGAINHLSAVLQVDGETLRGCAYYGGARNH